MRFLTTTVSSFLCCPSSRDSKAFAITYADEGTCDFFAERLVELTERFQCSPSLRVSEDDHPLTVKAKEMGNAKTNMLSVFCLKHVCPQYRQRTSVI